MCKRRSIEGAGAKGGDGATGSNWVLAAPVFIVIAGVQVAIRSWQTPV